jgi:hypothetical protein
MSSLPPFAPTSRTNQKLVIYHGTIDPAAASILSRVDTTKGSVATDFGKGFYTTTILRQAKTWAWMRSQRSGGIHNPAVVKLELNRDDVAGLQALWFVRGSYDADDFWSLVFHCRTGGSLHVRSAPATNPYDVVIGPAAASWKQRLTIFDADQVSFHTPAAEAILNGLSCVRSTVP